MHVTEGRGRTRVLNSKQKQLRRKGGSGGGEGGGGSGWSPVRRGEGTVREQSACGFVWAVTHAEKKYKNVCQSWITDRFSRWVLELQAGDRAPGTASVGLVLPQPAPSPASVWATLPLLPAAPSQSEDASQYGGWVDVTCPQWAVGLEPVGADPGRGCGGGRRSGRGWRRRQQLKESPAGLQALSQGRLSCRHLWALLPGGGRGVAEQQIWAKRCGGFWQLLGLMVSSLKRQEGGKWRCMMVSDLSLGYVCFSHPASGFSDCPPALAAQAPSPSLLPPGCCSAPP